MCEHSRRVVKGRSRKRSCVDLSDTGTCVWPPGRPEGAGLNIQAERQLLQYMLKTAERARKQVWDGRARFPVSPDWIPPARASSFARHRWWTLAPPRLRCVALPLHPLRPVKCRSAPRGVSCCCSFPLRFQPRIADRSTAASCLWLPLFLLLGANWMSASSADAAER